MTQTAPALNILSLKPYNQALSLASNKINAFSLSKNGSTPAFPNFSKNKLVISLYQRIAAPEKINQVPASLCGPASFFFVLAKYFPDVYVQAAIDLYQTGETKIGSLHIKPSNGAKSASAAKLTGPFGRTMNEVDWLLLASLRDSENDIFDYDNVRDQYPGITMPGQLTEWYRKVGAKQVINDTNIVLSKSIGKLFDAQKYKDNGYSICLFISMKILESNTAKPVFSPDHWVVLTSDILIDGNKITFNMAEKLAQERIDYYDEHSNVQSFKHNIAFDVYSWGESPSIQGGGVSKSNPVDLENFLRHYFGFVAVKF